MRVCWKAVDVTYAVLFVEDEVVSSEWLVVALDLHLGLKKHLQEALLELFDRLVLIS